MHSAQGNVRPIATVSSRKASASSAARSGPRSGMSRVLTEPGSGSLAKMETMALGINYFFRHGLAVMLKTPDASHATPDATAECASRKSSDKEQQTDDRRTNPACRKRSQLFYAETAGFMRNQAPQFRRAARAGQHGPATRPWPPSQSGRPRLTLARPYRSQGAHEQDP